MVPVTLSVHEYRLAERTTDGAHELAQHVHALLALKLAEVNIEVDFLGGHWPEDHQNGRDGPDTEINGLRVSRP